MIACERAGAPVPTGIVMTDLMFDDLGGEEAFAFRCPDCNELHTWQKPAAWLAD